MSEGKFSRWVRMTRRPGASAAWILSAAEAALNRLTEVVSVTTALPDPPPMISETVCPSLTGRPNQSAVFHDLMSPDPHSSAMTSCARSAAPFGRGPSEFPSR